MVKGYYEILVILEEKFPSYVSWEEIEKDISPNAKTEYTQGDLHFLYEEGLLDNGNMDTDQKGHLRYRLSPDGFNHLNGIKNNLISEKVEFLTKVVIILTIIILIIGFLQLVISLIQLLANSELAKLLLVLLLYN